MALGKSDYGLYGVVGGLATFIAFFNGLLGSSVARFFAYSIGKDSANREQKNATEECRKWFNTALMVHTLVPLVLITVGYPLGVWAIENWLTIPPDRVDVCVIVFRCVCLSCFVSMVNVPFSAMYTAKQYIAELTIYGVVANTLQACFLYYIASHPSDWLARYAMWTCFLAIVPQLIICLRAMKIFPECRIDLRLCWNATRLRQLCYFAGSLAFGGLGSMMRGQGVAILVNKYFGPAVNAAMSIANSVNAQSIALVSAMQGAFTPAIVQACGAGDEAHMRRLAFRACKFGVLLVLIFAIPLGIEIDNVMRLWLKTPPEYSAGLCLCMLAIVVVDKISVGHMIAVNAKGRIARYQMFLGTVLVMSLPVAWLFVALGLGVYSIGVALFLMSLACSIGRIWLARSLAGMSARYWLCKVALPVATTMLMATVVGFIPRLSFAPSFGRLCSTTLVVEIVLIPLAWLFVLDLAERRFFTAKIALLVLKFRRNL